MCSVYIHLIAWFIISFSFPSPFIHWNNRIKCTKCSSIEWICTHTLSMSLVECIWNWIHSKYIDNKLNGICSNICINGLLLYTLSLLLLYIKLDFDERMKITWNDFNSLGPRMHCICVWFRFFSRSSTRFTFPFE